MKKYIDMNILNASDNVLFSTVAGLLAYSFAKK